MLRADACGRLKPSATYTMCVILTGSKSVSYGRVEYNPAKPEPRNGSRVDAFVKSPKIPFSVIPSRIGVRDDGQAGIQSFQVAADHLDSGFHRSDDFQVT